jgi:hypothetical protein
MLPKISARNIGATSATRLRRPAVRRCEGFCAGLPHCVSTGALRLTVALDTKPKAVNIGEILRFAVIVTNWPPIPPPLAQLLPQVTVLPQVQLWAFRLDNSDRSCRCCCLR